MTTEVDLQPRWDANPQSPARRADALFVTPLNRDSVIIIYCWSSCDPLSGVTTSDTFCLNDLLLSLKTHLSSAACVKNIMQCVSLAHTVTQSLCNLSKIILNCSAARNYSPSVRWPARLCMSSTHILTVMFHQKTAGELAGF